jgi:hypothetical protein
MSDSDQVARVWRLVLRNHQKLRGRNDTIRPARYGSNSPRHLLAQDDLAARTLAAMKQATGFYHEQVAVQGGYVYEYSLDLKLRQGEGKAAPTEIWVQPPGTPTVGMAYVAAFEATGDKQFLTAAVDAARALMYGQLESGGWTASIDFDPKGPHADRYRNGKGRAKGKNYSTLDDDKSQAAICLLIKVDKALEFKDAEIHDATQLALKSLLAAQFANGGFPQGWKEPVSMQPVKPASYPNYDWRTENRIKEYWDYYTLERWSGRHRRTHIAPRPSNLR